MHPSTAPRGPISSSAPPQFRVKKKRPDEAPQNNGRETGPPMQKGPGQGSMFADGKKPFPPRGNQPMAPARHAPPPPARPPQRPGGRPMMMADGQPPEDMIGAPAPVGGMPDEQDVMPDQDDLQAGPPEGSPAGEMPIIRPEAVAYHDDAQNCQSCSFFGDGGQCKVLAMQVNPVGGCNAFEPGASPEGGDQGPVDTGAGFSQNDAGTSGAPSLS